MKLYLGGWYMYTLHIKCRCTETDSEKFLLGSVNIYMYNNMCNPAINFGSVKGGGERSKGESPLPPLGETLCIYNS